MLRRLSRLFNAAACRAALALIIAYQHSLGYILGGNCRFYPTCSQYARLVFERFGFFTALRLAATRLAKCHPLHPGGLDEPPRGRE